MNPISDTKQFLAQTLEHVRTIAHVSEDALFGVTIGAVLLAARAQASVASVAPRRRRVPRSSRPRAANDRRRPKAPVGHAAREASA